MNATVKRKFNALIQGIGTRPTSSAAAPDPNSSNNAAAGEDNTETSSLPDSTTSTMVNELQFLAKKRRVGQPGSTPARQGALDASQPQPAKGAATISNVVLRKWTPTGAPASKDAQQPKYSPADREQLLGRLASFQELTDWTPKPDKVNEIEWAKRGWVCQGKERVRCTLCNKELVVKLNRKEVAGKEVAVLVASEIEDALVEKYVELMVTAHQDDCLWRKRGCDDSLLRLPLAHPKTALENLRLRYDDLCARKDFIPYEFNLRLPEGLNLDTVLSHLPPDFFTSPPPPTDKSAGPNTAPTTPHKPNRPAFALALMGWEGLSDKRIGAVPNSASCHTCLRRLGLWMFKSKEVDLETNTILVPAPMSHLDPLREHRFFCPWKNGHAQRNPGARPTPKGEADKAGWEVLAQVLKNDAYLRSRGAAAARTDTLHARSKSTNVPQSAPPTTLSTPGRPTTAGSGVVGRGHDGPLPAFGPGVDEEDEDEATTTAKDKERWARLRRVKSLFNTKAGSKLKRTISRPGTGHSTLKGSGAGAGAE